MRLKLLHDDNERAHRVQATAAKVAVPGGELCPHGVGRIQAKALGDNLITPLIMAATGILPPTDAPKPCIVVHASINPSGNFTTCGAAAVDGRRETGGVRGDGGETGLADNPCRTAKANVRMRAVHGGGTGSSRVLGAARQTIRQSAQIHIACRCSWASGARANANVHRQVEGVAVEHEVVVAVPVVIGWASHWRHESHGASLQRGFDSQTLRWVAREEHHAQEDGE